MFIFGEAHIPSMGVWVLFHLYVEGAFDPYLSNRWNASEVTSVNFAFLH
jgi:hypothetical protein